MPGNSRMDFSEITSLTCSSEISRIIGYIKVFRTGCGFLCLQSILFREETKRNSLNRACLLFCRNVESRPCDDYLCLQLPEAVMQLLQKPWVFLIPVDVF